MTVQIDIKHNQVKQQKKRCKAIQPTSKRIFKSAEFFLVDFRKSQNKVVNGKRQIESKRHHNVIVLAIVSTAESVVIIIKQFQ